MTAHLRLASVDGHAIAPPDAHLEREYRMPMLLCRECRGVFISYGQWTRHDCGGERRAEALVVAVCVFGLAIIAVAAFVASRV